MDDPHTSDLAERIKDEHSKLKRGHMLRARITEQDHRMLREISSNLGVSCSEIIRHLIRREHDIVIGRKGEK